MRNRSISVFWKIYSNNAFTREKKCHTVDSVEKDKGFIEVTKNCELQELKYFL